MGTITRRMEKALHDLEKEFQALYTRDDFQCQLVQLRGAEKTSARPSALARLYEMLRQAGIPFESGRETAYYERLIREADLPGLDEIQEKLLLALYERYRAYPDPGAYMKRIVDRLEKEEEGWRGDPLRLRILKQFVCYGGYLAEAGRGGRKVVQDYAKAAAGHSLKSAREVAAYLDDGVFAGLESASKPQRKPEGKYGLLKIADDLALGKFREGGATKKDLYLFAMVYGMTYFSGQEGETFDAERDLEKNLFQDYYTNNLMRFLSDVYVNRLSEYEMDPSGQGINYKNFAEMVYLYYIRRDMTAEEKIRRSARMITRIREEAFQSGFSKDEASAWQGTAFYRDNIRRGTEDPGEEVLERNEEEFARYLLENYDCDTYTSTYMTAKGPVAGRISEMQLQAGQETAFAQYRQLLAELKEQRLTADDCRYGLWFTDLDSWKKNRPETDPDYENYLQLLLAIDRFLSSGKLLQIRTSGEVTRTAMLVAYYYLYNALHETEEVGRSFGDIYREFKNGLDRYLVPSCYQPVSGRSLIDVIVIFSSYTYLNG